MPTHQPETKFRGEEICFIFLPLNPFHWFLIGKVQSNTLLWVWTGSQHLEITHGLALEEHRYVFFLLLINKWWIWMEWHIVEIRGHTDSRHYLHILSPPPPQGCTFTFLPWQYTAYTNNLSLIVKFIIWFSCAMLGQKTKMCTPWVWTNKLLGRSAAWKVQIQLLKRV